MKNRFKCGVVLALLLGSIVGNVWQYEKAIRIREFDRQFIQIPKRDFRDMTSEDPILGLSGEELSDVVQKVVDETKDASEQRILSVEKHGHDNVVVRTGSIQGPLAGRGYIFRFHKANNEWVGGKESDLMWYY